MVLYMADQEVADSARRHWMSDDIAQPLTLSIAQIVIQKLRRCAHSIEFREQACYRPPRNINVAGIQPFVHSVVWRLIASGGNQSSIRKYSLSVNYVHEHFLDRPLIRSIFIVQSVLCYGLKIADCLDRVLVQQS